MNKIIFTPVILIFFFHLVTFIFTIPILFKYYNDEKNCNLHLSEINIIFHSIKTLKAIDTFNMIICIFTLVTMKILLSKISQYLYQIYCNNPNPMKDEICLFSNVFNLNKQLISKFSNYQYWLYKALNTKKIVDFCIGLYTVFFLFITIAEYNIIETQSKTNIQNYFCSFKIDIDGLLSVLLIRIIITLISFACLVINNILILRNPMKYDIQQLFYFYLYFPYDKKNLILNYRRTDPNELRTSSNDSRGGNDSNSDNSDNNGNGIIQTYEYDFFPKVYLGIV